MQNFQAKFEGYLTLHYRPAQLYTNKLGWYIEYATLTDDQKSFRRKRIKLNRLRKKCQTMMDFRTKAESIVTTINNQLQMHYAPMQTLPAMPQQMQYVQVPVVSQATPVMQYIAPLPPLPSALFHLYVKKC